MSSLIDSNIRMLVKYPHEDNIQSIVVQVPHPALLKMNGRIIIEASKCEIKKAYSFSLKGLDPHMYEQVDL
jgi:hypothetical protein